MNTIQKIGSICALTAAIIAVQSDDALARSKHVSNSHKTNISQKVTEDEKKIVDNLKKIPDTYQRGDGTDYFTLDIKVGQIKYSILLDEDGCNDFDNPQDPIKRKLQFNKYDTNGCTTTLHLSKKVGNNKVAYKRGHHGVYKENQRQTHYSHHEKINLRPNNTPYHNLAHEIRGQLEKGKYQRLESK